MDHVRFAVEPVPEKSGGGFQVLVYVNDVEMTQAGAGLGMDPYDVLIPDNKFLPVPGGRTFGIARCTCGVYDCGSTDVTIMPAQHAVTWEWKYETPIHHPLTFHKEPYLAEVERLAADHSWETPDRTAGRLVWTGLDADRLRAKGFALSWVSNDYRAPKLFQACLLLDRGYHIFLRFPWEESAPEQLARRVLACLNAADAPEGWTATWRGISASTRAVPPPIARGNWGVEHPPV